ncbi:MAG: hypothetical protein QW279_01540 [Candidatus Jordarchaeaceae archaeon]
MRRPLITAVGIFVLIAGLIILAFSTTSKRFPVVIDHKEVNNKNSLSKSFNSGSILGINFSPNASWSLDPVETRLEIPPGSGDVYGGSGTGVYGVKLLTINVTNPLGNSSCFDLYLMITTPAGGAGAVTLFPNYFPPPEPDEGGLIVNTTEGREYPKIEQAPNINLIALGVTPVAGNYTVECGVSMPSDLVFDKFIENGSIWIHEAGPPAYLSLYEIVYETQGQPSYMLAAGVISSVSGVLIIIWQNMPSKTRKVEKAVGKRPIQK